MNPMQSCWRLLPAFALAASLSGCGRLFDWEDRSPEAIEAALRIGDYAKGRGLVAKATEDGDATAEVLILAARIHLDAGDGIRAEKALREAAAAQGEKRLIGALLGEAIARQGKPKPALSVAAKSGNKSALYYVIGLNALFANDSWKARENFEKAFALDPKNDRVAIDLAYVRAEMGLFDQASQLAGTVSSTMPANLRAHKAMADIAQREHNAPAAILAFDRILKLSPSDSGALIGKTQTLLASKKYDQADALIKAMPEDLRNGNEARMLLGKVAARRGQFEEAYKQFSLVRDAVDTDDEALFLFGLTNVRRGQPWTGISLMEAALRSRPDLPEYHAGVISALRSVGETETVKQRIAAIPENLRGARELQELVR